MKSTKNLTNGMTKAEIEALNYYEEKLAEFKRAKLQLKQAKRNLKNEHKNAKEDRKAAELEEVIRNYRK